MNYEIQTIENYNPDFDFTSIDNIIFGKSISGEAKVNMLSEIFNNIYTTKQTPTRYRLGNGVEYVFKLSDRVITFRGFAHKIVAYINIRRTPYSNMTKSDAVTRGDFFEEDSTRLFQFKAMLNKIRDYDRIKLEQERERELQALKVKFDLLSLKNLVIDDCDINKENVRDYGLNSVKINTGTNAYDNYVKITYRDDSYFMDVRFNTNVNEENLKALLKCYKNIYEQ